MSEADEKTDSTDATDPTDAAAAAESADANALADAADTPDSQGAEAAEPAYPWHVRESGMKYAHTSVDTVIDFLKKRESFDQIEISRDDGETWVSVYEVPELADVEPAQPRKRAKSDSPGASSPAPQAAQAAKPTPARKESTTPGKTGSSAGAEGEDVKKRLMVLGPLLAAIVVGVLIYFGVVASEPSMPSTPAAEQGAWIMQQLNGDGSTITPDALRSRFASSAQDSTDFDALAEQMRGMAARMTDVRFTGTAARNGDHSIDLRITNDMQQDGVLTVRTDPGSGGITAFRVLAADQYRP